MPLKKSESNRTYITLAGILAMTALLFGATAQSASATLKQIEADKTIVFDKCIRADVDKRIIIAGTVGAKLEKLYSHLEYERDRGDGKLTIYLKAGQILCLTLSVDKEIEISKRGIVIEDRDCIEIVADTDLVIKIDDKKLVDLEIDDTDELCITDEDLIV